MTLVDLFYVILPTLAFFGGVWLATRSDERKSRR